MKKYLGRLMQKILQVGAHFPQVSGDNIPKSFAITGEVLDGLTIHRSEALSVLLSALLKNQLKKIPQVSI